MKSLILFFTLFFISAIVEAKYTQTCDVKYKTEDGWSKTYTVDVTFLTGFELNDATKSYNYNTYSVYAVIFWGQDKATVIEISGYTGCSSEVDKRCITNTYSDWQGKDQDGDKWNICVSQYCF